MIVFYFLLFIMPLTRHPLWAHLAADVTVFKWVGMLCLVYAGLHLINRKSLPPLFGSIQPILFLLLFTLAGFSFLTKSSSGAFRLSPFLSYISFLLLLFVTLTAVDDLKRLRLSLLVCVGSVAFASLYVLREWQKGIRSFGFGFRPGWVVGDPNYFAISTLLCIPIAFYLRSEGHYRWQKMYCNGCMLITLLTMVLGGSRGGFLGLLVALVLGLVKSPNRMRNLTFAMIFLLPLLIVAPASPLQRIFHPDWGSERSVTNHMAAWLAGLHMIRTHPLFGVGLGNFKLVMPLYEPRNEWVVSIAHNTYIEIAAELGIPGLLIFIAILFFSYHELGRVCKKTASGGPQLLNLASLAIQTGLAGYSVAAFFLSAEYQKFLWLMIFLSADIPYLQRAVANLNPVLQPVKNKHGRGLWASGVQPTEAQERKPTHPGAVTASLDTLPAAKHPGATLPVHDQGNETGHAPPNRVARSTPAPARHPGAVFPTGKP